MSVDVPTDVESRAHLAAEARWIFAKTLVEPHIASAANDPTALGLLPNHEFLIRSYVKTQCIVKCRKTAHSWGVALDALARAATEPRSTSIILSYDEDEARDKNYFISWIYDVLPPALKRELKMTDGSEERRFLNGSRIKMIARKAPTGAGATIYLDEFSVEGRSGATAQEILVAAIGATTHGGYIRAGGTQRGPHTLFNKIVTGQWKESIASNPEDMEGLPDLEWEIGDFPWWLSPALCIDCEAAAREAPQMETKDRVRKFGNDKLKIQFVSYLQTPDVGLELFQREFEGKVLDDSESYFPLSLITACQPRGAYIFESCECAGAGQEDRAYSLINSLAAKIRGGFFPGEWCAAMDVGRDHDRSEITIAHNLPEDRSSVMLRGLITMDKMPFPQQQAVWAHLQKTIQLTAGYVDGTRGSIGRQISEWAFTAYGDRSKVFEFTNSSKQIIASGMKSRMENGRWTMPEMEKLQKQYLAIKKKVTPSGNALFDAERNKHGHADAFWSCAMLGDLFATPVNTNAYAFTGTMPQSPLASGFDRFRTHGTSRIFRPNMAQFRR